MRQQAGRDESQHGVTRGKQDLGLRLERLGLQAVLQWGALLLFGYFYVMRARRIERFGIPPERFGLFHRALRVVAERSGPVHREPRAQLMADIDRILHTMGGE